MPQIKVTVPEEVHNILKERAERDDRSLNNYLGRLLKQIASQPDVFSTPGIPTTPVPGPGIPTTPYQVTATTTTTTATTPASASVPTRLKRIGIDDVDEHSNSNKSIETPKTPSKKETSTHTNSLKEQVKIYLDTYDVHPKDHSMATYKKLKEKFTKLDIETFDKIQHERAGD